MSTPAREAAVPEVSPALQIDARRARRHLARADPALGRLMEKVGPFRLPLQELHTPYEALARAILHQQLNGKAAAAIEARVQAHFGTERFPAPERVQQASLEELRACGLSRAKALAVVDLAERTRSGQVPPLAALGAMGDEEIVDALTAVRGIGRWTVEMLLIFRLGRPDVLPATDYGIRQGFRRVFRRRELPAPREILERGERWRPHRTVASWYLWRSLDP